MFLNKLKPFCTLFLDSIFPARHKPRGILGETEKALRDWHEARKLLDNVDSDMMDYAIYNLNATERRYIALLKQSRKKGITSW